MQVLSARVTSGLCWLYFLAVCSIWGVMDVCGDRWWFATVMLYAPRWIYLLPQVGLVPLSAWWHRWSLIPLVLGSVVVVVPVMGFNVPSLWSKARATRSLRVLTCNIAELAECRERLAQLVVREQPDVVALQEVGSVKEFAWPDGWHVERQGSQLVASRFPLTDVQSSFRPRPNDRWPPVNALRCTINAPTGAIVFCNVHLMTPRPGLERVLNRWTIVNPTESSMLSTIITERRQESQVLEKWLAAASPCQIVAGDFNQTPDSAIFRESWTSHFTDAFAAVSWGYGYTKTTVKRAFRYGARIDHILYGGPYRCTHCWLAEGIGSDHLPLLADLGMP